MDHNDDGCEGRIWFPSWSSICRGSQGLPVRPEHSHSSSVLSTMCVYPPNFLFYYLFLTNLKYSLCVPLNVFFIYIFFNWPYVFQVTESSPPLPHHIFLKVRFMVWSKEWQAWRTKRLGWVVWECKMCSVCTVKRDSLCICYDECIDRGAWCSIFQSWYDVRGGGPNV